MQRFSIVLKKIQARPSLMVIAVVTLFVVIGSTFMLFSRAATPIIALEAESGTRTAPAKVTADTTASAGSSVQFVAPVTLPSTTGSVFTFASLPDTQRDTHNAAGIERFNSRLNYLVQNKTALNLAYVWQVGDLQDWDDATHSEYEVASTGLKILENAKIPYALAVGNHDTNAVCAGGSACPGANTNVEVRNTKTWNQYYPPSRFPGLTVFEAGKTDNAYRTFSAGGVNWLLINYELWPRTVVVDWMKTVVASHPNYNIIFDTHSHLDGDGVTISSSNGGYGANSPKYVYDQVISKYPNVRFVFSGHVGNAGYREDTGVSGNKIYTFMDCYHDTTNNWIRLLTMDTTKNTITTKVYAPYTNQTRTEAAANVSISGVSWVR